MVEPFKRIGTDLPTRRFVEGLTPMLVGISIWVSCWNGPVTTWARGKLFTAPLKKIQRKQMLSFDSAAVVCAFRSLSWQKRICNGHFSSILQTRNTWMYIAK